jgi:hypothetical protein
MISLLLTIGIGASAVLAQNSTVPKTCTIPSKYQSSNGTADDSPAIASAFAECKTGGTIVFEEGVDYNVFKPILAQNLTDVTISMNGNLHLPQDIESTRALILASTATIFWFDIKGSNVHWTGSESINNGWINSYGQQWWDANPSNGTGITGRPHLMVFNVKTGSIKRLKSRKPIAWNVQVKGSDIEISDSIVDAVSDKWESFPFNTDAFDIGATDVKITNLVAFNGDDAVAVNDGAHNLYVSDSTIGYQTHGTYLFLEIYGELSGLTLSLGLSIGSLGKSQGKFANVSNIHFDRITVAGGLYAARLKSWVGGQGLVENVTWVSNPTGYAPVRMSTNTLSVGLVLFSPEASEYKALSMPENRTARQPCANATRQKNHTTDRPLGATSASTTSPSQSSSPRPTSTKAAPARLTDRTTPA